MANINEILQRAASLRDETALNSISPERAGGIMYDTLIALNELWLQQGSALVISKIYASVSAMEADTAPVSDLTGQPLRPGQIVVIASSDSDNGSVYRYNGTTSPSWTSVGKIGNLEPVDSLDSDSTTLPLAAHQGKVLDGKISQLGQQVDEIPIVSVSQNTSTGHTDVTVGNTTTPVASVDEVDIIRSTSSFNAKELGGKKDSFNLTNSDYSGIFWQGEEDGWGEASTNYNSFIIPLAVGQKIVFDTFYVARIFDYLPSIGKNRDYIHTVDGVQEFSNTYNKVVWVYFLCTNASSTQYNMSVELTNSGVFVDIDRIDDSINGLNGLRQEVGFAESVKSYTNDDYSGLIYADEPDGWVASSANYNSFIIPLAVGQKITFNSFYLARIFDYEPALNAHGAEIQVLDNVQEFTNTYNREVWVYFLCTNASSTQYNVLVNLDGKGIENKLSKVAGKKLNIVCFGDSITEINEYYATEKHYSDYIKDYLYCNTFNFGVGGTRITERGARTLTPQTDTDAYANLDIPSMVEAWCTRNFSYVDSGADYIKNEHTEPQYTVQRLRDILPADTDVVTILGGTNDWTSAGAFGSETDADDGTSDNTLWGALKHIVKMILTANPRIKICIFSPIPRYAGYQSGESVVPDNAHWSDNVVIYGKKLPEYVEEIMTIGKAQHLPSCNLYWSLGWNQYNIMAFMRNDGVADLTHPYRGLEPLGEKIARFIFAN